MTVYLFLHTVTCATSEMTLPGNCTYNFSCKQETVVFTINSTLYLGELIGYQNSLSSCLPLGIAGHHLTCVTPGRVCMNFTCKVHKSQTFEFLAIYNKRHLVIIRLIFWVPPRHQQDSPAYFIRLGLHQTMRPWSITSTFHLYLKGLKITREWLFSC